MFAKLFLLAVLVSLVSCQAVSTCTSTSFNFYNGYPGGNNFGEQKWDFTSDGSFSDGTSDTFDSYFYTDITFGGSTYFSSDYTPNPVEFFCDVGTTDVTSASVARYTYNLTDTVQLRREFFAPRADTWLRAIDTIENFGTEILNITMLYNGNLGSDDDTRYAELNEFYWVSSDGADGTDDPPFSMNAGSLAGLIPPQKLFEFVNGEDDTDWKFEITLAPGQSATLMHILGQYNNLSDAINGGAKLNALDNAIFQNMTVPPGSILNWGLCIMKFTVEAPQDVYCEASPTVVFEVSHNDALTFNGESVTISNGKVTVGVNKGVNTFSYHRFPESCPAQTAEFTFTVPDADLSASVDTTGAWPVVTPTGGFGAPYKYNVEVSSPDFNDLFGSKVQFTVHDSKMCSFTVEVTIPDEPVSPPIPGKVASASKVIGSAVAFAAAMLVL